ncbi:hypothetical protein [Pseudoalteromonas sp. MMG005]|uniref:hypothetical protein n=1 Tax=Pseudoalteromonas sp. MMG005 TaxID=2822682 RepID=UPI001B3A007F|nr:hypothetical protein [Pseudoalteromonas sp. MMG005]MBQ4847823.1 hypothetical protein [Pseudoalteromonas sp. MMG005]
MIIKKLPVALCVGMSALSTVTIAHDIYPKGSECEVTFSSKTISLSAMHFTKNKETEFEQIAHVKQRLFEKATKALAQYNTSMMIKSMRFKSHTKDALVAKAEFLPVSSCAKDIPRVNTTSLDLFSNNIMHLKQKVNLGYAISVNKEVIKTAPLKLESNLISDNAIFGIKLGESMQSVERDLGRFSLLWPLSDGAYIAFIGRDNALFFSDHKFVGYQYNESLLPISLRNHLEFFNEGIRVYDPTTGDAFSSGEELTTARVKALKGAYKNVQIVKVKTSDEAVVDKLVGLSVGDTSLLTGKFDALPCPDAAALLQRAPDLDKSLVQLFGMSGKRALLTGCHQKIEMNYYGTVTSIELLDPLTSTNMELKGGSRLLQSLKPWQFGTVSQGDSVNQLPANELGEANLDVIEWSNNLWEGHFVLDNDTVVAGTLIPIKL